MARYILSIDQSTQGTKALLCDETGALVCRADLPHRQLVDERGWVEHDLNEIYQNTLQVIQNVVAKAGIDKGDIVALGISNQRETAACWHRGTGEPVYNAIVWQCARGAAICERLAPHAAAVQGKTGLRLSPYFTAAKLAWILENVPGVREAAQRGEICMGTIDSYLIYRLTGGRRHQTDFSNASRTQLFNLFTLSWDEELLALFGIPMSCMARVTDSNGDFGQTDLEGWLAQPIPIHAALGDSHAALFGQGCLAPGMVKATYGTGSSIMMNVGETPVFSDLGVVSSIAWGMDGKVSYVLEGNINYTGAVVTWLKDDVQLITSAAETGECAMRANPADHTCLVPAFSGLGAPWWDSHAEAAIVGMTRTTGRNEIVRAALDCIAHQIADIVSAMSQSAGTPIAELRVDGGPTRNAYLMQFQSDMLGIPVRIPDCEELSGIGAAWAAGRACGLYDDRVFGVLRRTAYTPQMDAAVRQDKRSRWASAVRMVRQKEL